MFRRSLVLPTNRSFFLFGARNTGKSTLIEEQFQKDTCLWIDLLDTDEQMKFLQRPEDLYDIVMGLPDNIKHIIIDEIQKVPKLLDVVHRLLKNKKRFFVMTGSSARKLKKGGANLLAGRAFVYDLFPLTHIEIGESFNLDSTLQWGTLPEIFDFETQIEKNELLMAYAHTYIKEEIWDEHFIKNLVPFRRFLEVAAQCNGKIINYAKIASDVGVDDKTVKSHFSILEDTLLGFYLEAHHNSIRKQLSIKPKFYLFDTGIVRALARQLDVPLKPGTHAYGNAFEHFIITECFRIASYRRVQYKFSYLRTANDVEVDLIIERPGKTTLYIEIKSTTNIQINMISNFKNLTKHLKNSEAICISNDPYQKKLEHIIALPWKQGIQYIFDTKN